VDLNAEQNVYILRLEKLIVGRLVQWKKEIMKNNKGLTWILFATLSILILSVTVLFVLNPAFFRNKSSSIDSSAKAESLSLSQFLPIQGTSIFVASVGPEREGSSYLEARFSYDYGYTTRNLVFLDGNTLTSHYLFQSNEKFVVSLSQFPKPKSDLDNQPIAVKWLVYEIAQQDSNMDGKINSQDTFSVAMSNASGQNYIELIQNVSETIAMNLLDNHYLLLVYKTNGEYWVSKIDLDQQSILETKKHPEPTLRRKEP
jgi:hypothetical protein